MFKLYLIFILIMSLITFILYLVDKAKAKKNAWRIKEATLLLFSFFGGALGGYIGMLSLRHKTKHWYFWYGLPAMLIAQILLSLWLVWWFCIR